MANSDYIITQAGPYGPQLLDHHAQLAMLALGLYSLAHSNALTTTAATVKTDLAAAETAMRGIPRQKLLPIFTSLVFAALNAGGGGQDLANTSITTKTQSVAYAYLLAMDDDALMRLALWDFGVYLSILS